MIKGENITLFYNEKKILKEVSFDVLKGRITTLLGRSGAGKTSLLRCIANLNSTYTGTLMLQNKAIKELSSTDRARHIGFVAQAFNLFPHMTVLENCVHPMMTVLNIPRGQAEKKAMEVLESLEMHSFVHSFPKNLSGGQQQRVAIARALSLDPEVLLFDEPTSALDPDSTKSLKKLLKELCKKGITIVVTSHDMPFVRGIVDRIYFLEDGKIVDTFDKNTDTVNDSSKIQEFLRHGDDEEDDQEGV